MENKPLFFVKLHKTLFSEEVKEQVLLFLGHLSVLSVKYKILK